MTMFGYCEGDVTNLQGARLFERSQYIEPDDPFPRIQMSVLGANHNWFNTRLVRRRRRRDRHRRGVRHEPAEQHPPRAAAPTTSTTRGSGDPALMGDQEKVGLAMMSRVLPPLRRRRRRLRPVHDGRDQRGRHDAGSCPPRPARPRRPARASRASTACMTSYFAAPAERRDVLRPETDNPLDGQRARHGDHRLRLLEPVPGDRRHHPASGDDARAASTGATRSRRTSLRRSSASPACRPRPRAARSPPPARSAARAATRENAPGQPLLRAAARAGVGPAGVDRHPAFPPPRAT